MESKRETKLSTTISGADKAYLDGLVERTKNTAIIIGGPYDGRIVEGTTERMTNRARTVEYQRKLWRIKDRATGLEIDLLIYHDGNFEQCLMSMGFKLGLIGSKHL